MSAANPGTKPIREINRNFKYYKWTNSDKLASRKIANIVADQLQQGIGTGSNGIANQLTLGKTYKYNLNMSFIKLYYNNERVIFQTPMLFVPYSPRKGEFGAGSDTSGGSSFKESYYLTASLFNDEYDPEVSEFESWINDLEVQVLKLLRKRPYLNASATGKTPLLKFDDYRACQKLNLKFERGNAKFYVIEGKSRLSKAMPFQDIIMPCYAVFIIELGGIWIRKHAVDGADTDTEWGINFILHGAQCTPSHIEPSPLGVQPSDFIYNPGMHDIASKSASYVPPPPPPPLPPSLIFGQTDPLLAPYLKMLKLGIPRDAVRQKMILAGDDPILLDTHLTNNNRQQLLLPPPPLNFKQNILTNIPTNMPTKITSDMLATVQLKKTDPNNIQGPLPKKPGQPQSGFKVDLSDILAVKSRLKPRDPTDNDKDSYAKIFKKNN